MRPPIYLGGRFLLSLFKKICIIAFFLNIGMLAYGTWLENFDLKILSIVNMLLLTPAFLKESDELK